MPRTVLAAQQLPGELDYNGEALAFTAADVANKNATLWESGLYVLARNSGGTVRSVTVSSVPDALDRTRDLVASVAAGEVRCLGPFFQASGWKQPTAELHFEAEHAEVLFCVLTP